MKKMAMLLTAAMMILALPGCGGKGADQGAAKSQYADSLEILNKVVESYDENDLFAMYGGDQQNAVMDGPGKFDISKTEELDYTLGLPADQFSNIEDAASMVHLMNANTFTAAAYRLKEDVDGSAFADSVKSGILARQWICGQPDTLIIIDVDGRYVITAYGEAQIMETFKNNALGALDGAQVITETPIA